MREVKVTDKDYFPTLVAMANENNEITTEISNGKPLDQFLAKRFNLSKSTVQALLSTWEREGRITMEKHVLTGKISGIRLLDFFSRQKSNNKTLVLIDLENIRLNTDFLREKFSMTAGFDRIQRQIIQDIGGEIVYVFIFASPHLTSTEAETFYKEGFYVVLCPRVKTKEGESKDTVDEILMEFLKDSIKTIPNLTHICLGSGDKDFCQALRKALRKGLKLIIVAGSLTSLSSDLIDLADTNPLTGKKMVYIFSPVADYPSVIDYMQQEESCCFLFLLFGLDKLFIIAII